MLLRTYINHIINDTLIEAGYKSKHTTKKKKKDDGDNDIKRLTLSAYWDQLY